MVAISLTHGPCFYPTSPDWGCHQARVIGAQLHFSGHPTQHRPVGSAPKVREDVQWMTLGEAKKKILENEDSQHPEVWNLVVKPQNCQLERLDDPTKIGDVSAPMNIKNVFLEVEFRKHTWIPNSLSWGIVFGDISIGGNGPPRKC